MSFFPDSWADAFKVVNRDQKFGAREIDVRIYDTKDSSVSL